MSQFTILCFKQSAISSRYWLERCLKQYLLYHARVFSNGINNRHKNYITKRKNVNKSKTFTLRVFQDIKQTKRKVEVIIEKENIWTVPNFLCVGRILTSPYLSYLILSQDYQVKRYNIQVYIYSLYIMFIL